MDTFLKIKELCEEKGIKISDLSRETGISSSVFTELKKGRSKSLSVRNLEKISAYFKVPLSMLTEDGKEEKQNALFEKRKLLFDLSGRATEEDLDRIIKIVDALTGEKDG